MKHDISTLRHIVLKTPLFDNNIVSFDTIIHTPASQDSIGFYKKQHSPTSSNRSETTGLWLNHASHSGVSSRRLPPMRHAWLKAC